MDIKDIYICLKWQVTAKIKMRKSKRMRTVALIVQGDLKEPYSVHIKREGSKKGYIQEVVDKKAIGICFAFFMKHSEDRDSTLNENERSQLWAYINHQNLISHG